MFEFDLIIDFSISLSTSSYLQKPTRVTSTLQWGTIRRYIPQDSAYFSIEGPTKSLLDNAVLRQRMWDNWTVAQNNYKDAQENIVGTLQPVYLNEFKSAPNSNSDASNIAKCFNY